MAGHSFFVACSSLWRAMYCTSARSSAEVQGTFLGLVGFFAGKLTIDSHPCKTPVMHGD